METALKLLQLFTQIEKFSSDCIGHGLGTTNPSLCRKVINCGHETSYNVRC